ncbi:hypothetical protein QF037_000517 [Streptomyces canus]|nr:hypothetical protein [Streptomyces canus]
MLGCVGRVLSGMRVLCDLPNAQVFGVAALELRRPVAVRRR